MVQVANTMRFILVLLLVISVSSGTSSSSLFSKIFEGSKDTIRARRSLLFGDSLSPSQMHAGPRQFPNYNYEPYSSKLWHVLGKTGNFIGNTMGYIIAYLPPIPHGGYGGSGPGEEYDMREESGVGPEYNSGGYDGDFSSGGYGGSAEDSSDY